MTGPVAAEPVTGSAGQGYNFAALLDRAVRRWPDREAVVAGERRLTYRDLRDRASGVARMLRERGISPGDRVAVLLGNGVEFLEICYGTMLIGAVFLPINARLAPPEVRYILDHAEASLLFTDAGWPERLGRDVGPPVVVAPGPEYAAGTGDQRPVLCAPAAYTDLQRLMYTSGTTGHPKGVMIHHGAVLWKCLNQVVEFALGREEVFLASGPLYHVGTLDLPGIGVHLIGGTVVVLPRFDEREWLETVQRERVTCTFLAPSMINRLARYPGFADYDLSALRVLIDGSEKMPASLLERMPSLFPNAEFFDGFGMTETVTSDCFLDPGRLHDKLGSVGRPTLAMELAVVDEADEQVPAGVPGELVVRGPKLCLGYWRDEQATAEAFRGGWFHTGDIATIDEDGDVTVVDRKKDMINSGGENVSSVEVERVLDRHPAVAEVAVVAAPDPTWGEVPVAFVVAHDEAPAASDLATELAEYCRERLARFKVPKEFHLVAELPRTSSGKVLKRELRQRAARMTGATA